MRPVCLSFYVETINMLTAIVTSYIRSVSIIMA